MFFLCSAYEGGRFLCQQEEVQNKEISFGVVSKSSAESHRVKILTYNDYNDSDNNNEKVYYFMLICFNMTSDM